MDIQCCKCKRYRVENEWKHFHHAEHELTSHTYCPTCLEEAINEITREMKDIHGATVLPAFSAVSNLVA